MQSGRESPPGCGDILGFPFALGSDSTLAIGGWCAKRDRRSDGGRFPDALLWLARSDGRWRDLPERFGAYQTFRVSVMIKPYLRSMFDYLLAVHLL
jgi:hypothetical protein